MQKTNYYEKSIQKMKYNGYSPNTIKSYSAVIYNFLEWSKCYPSRLKSDDIQKYLNTLTFKSGSHKNRYISSLKFFYEKVLLKKNLSLIDFARPRPKKTQPRVIDQQRLKKIILSVKNVKHKAILSLGFSCALRISEVKNIKICDIDSDRMTILVRNGKGNKDRYVPFTQELLKILRNHYRENKPEEYLFDISISSMQKICKKHCKTNFHTLRHSGATAMMENGTHLNILQSILGHKKSTTTEIYLHISKSHLEQAKMAI